MNLDDLKYFNENYKEKIYAEITILSSKSIITKIVIDRLIEHKNGKTIFECESEEQAKKILRDKILLEKIEKEKFLNFKIETCKRNKLKEIFYALFPFSHKRFYNEISLNNYNHFYEEKIKQLQDINIESNGKNYENYEFKFMRLKNHDEIYFVSGDDMTLSKSKVMYLKYHINDLNINISFNINVDGKIYNVLSDKDKLFIEDHEDIFIFDDKGKAKEKVLGLLNDELNKAKDIVKNLENEIEKRKGE